MIGETEIYINGRKLRLGEGQVVALTKQINDIAEIKSRRTNLTNSFRIDYFDENEKHLNFAGRPGSTTKYPYRFLPARVVQNGFEVVRNGNGLIKSTGAHSASITVYWGNNDFFDRLKFPLSELDMSELDHVFSSNSALNLGEQKNWDIFYPFIEYGHNSLFIFRDTFANRDIISLNLSKSFPAVKYNYVLQKIAQKIGFTFSGSIFQDGVFRNLAFALQSKKGVLNNKEFAFVKSENTQIGTVTSSQYAHNVVIQDNFPDSFPRQFLPDGRELLRNRYINNIGLRASFKFRMVLNHVMDGPVAPDYPYVVWIQVHADNQQGGWFLRERRDVLTENSPFTTPRDFIFDVVLFAGDILIIHYRGNIFTPVRFFPGSTFETIDITPVEIAINDTYPIAVNMPELTAYDFIKIIAQMYGVIFDTSGREVQWITYDDIAQTKGQNKELPVKIIKDSITTEFAPGNYYQVNNVIYSEGEVAENLTASFSIDNKQLDKQGDLIEIEAYLPAIREKENIGNIMHITMFDENGEQEKINIPLFFLQAIPVSALSEHTYGYSATGTGVAVISRDIPFGNLESITRTRRGEPVPLPQGITPNAIIQTNYRGLRKVLDDFKKYTVYCYMSEAEFFALNHYEAYYVPELLTFVYIEKISNYVSGRPCQMTLIKI